VVNSISKSFNYASLQAGYVLVSNQKIHHKLQDIMFGVFGEQVDALALSAINGCLTPEGSQWINIITSIIQSNFRKLVVFKKNVAPLLELANLEASYIVYMDFRKYFKNLK
jgi:cystathionine beta-lyase